MCKKRKKWTHVDLNAMNSFSKSAIRMTKCADNLSTCGERIKKIDKKNDYSECLLCIKDAQWEYLILCDMNEKIRDDWFMRTKDKFQEILKKRNVAEHKRKIIEETEN